MFKRTTTINKILKLKKFVRGIQGGTSAGKTFGILPVIINLVLASAPLEASVVAESYPHLRRGALKDFKKIMISTKRWDDKCWNKTDSIYTFRNGSTIEFFSADNDSKLRGARRDILYMNEANNMTFHAYTELASRTKLCVYLDWNPVSPFWFHENLQNDEDVDFLIVNYLDNESCPESAKKFIEKAKEKALTSKFWANWYQVYGLGLTGNLEGVIFDNWEAISILPKDARLLGRGLDFGYTNDPTTAIDIYYYNGKYILDQVIYATGLTNPDISQQFKINKINNSITTYCDSAEPKSIAELKQLGIKAAPAIKGSDSIIFGIQIMQQKDFLVTDRSIELIKEFRNYTWEVDKQGNKLNKPIDYFNHCIDAIRYYFQSTIKPKNSAPKKVISI